MVDTAIKWRGCDQAASHGPAITRGGLHERWLCEASPGEELPVTLRASRAVVPEELLRDAAAMANISTRQIWEADMYPRGRSPAHLALRTRSVHHHH
eukprot:CAMPEP_0181191406 /NCGR_PEP_ID=MMETSP1096-20121128/12718_1 /TAXON_ID=156174 ORGANISM="Chrysochromulina ericina, Strain CCMP281" /NCGR_SAMPLE_ID=MMETSP1096 /ASSEMBLY_ACC=CAM_ASM_000453 /LENGTH=96 /DNA_ID=CAMNT_0023280703 /DNA_START=188 /DNA_END=478 /DNA_ORIENTATION=+